MPGVIGAFDDAVAARTAVAELKRKRWGDFTVYMPAPDHDIEHVIDAGPSVVRRFALIGGLAGMTFGYWIPIWVSRYWPLVVGGKALGSWIPYTIISFELMVLIGGLSTVAGLFVAGRFPRITTTIGYDPRFSLGSYGVWVECTPDRAREVETALRGAGAVEVHSES
jgi:molybdopterin-containing oxidoreductase family membrane subunit